MAFHPRTLDEQLPMKCGVCAFEFTRSLAEHEAIGRMTCPKCFAPIVLSEAELRDVARAVDILHSIEDDFMGMLSKTRRPPS